MEMSTRITIPFIGRLPMPLIVNLPCNTLIVRNIIAKIVLVDEIFSRVVGRIDKHIHFDTI